MHIICRLTLLSIPILLLAIYVSLNVRLLHTLKDLSAGAVDAHFNGTTLLVVAHPDDETMFFGPTLLNLMKNNKSLSIIYLSKGDADNLGNQRKRELEDVMLLLGPRVDHVVVEDRQLSDNLYQHWDTAKIAEHIERYIRNYDTPIKTILTFDEYGVSGHPNHKSVHLAVKGLKNQLKNTYDFFSLKSVSWWKKYSLFLDIAVVRLTNYLLKVESDKSITLAIDLSTNLLLKKILKLHKSQMVWFRYLYMNFSRYMFINELERVI